MAASVIEPAQSAIFNLLTPTVVGNGGVDPCHSPNQSGNPAITSKSLSIPSKPQSINPKPKLK